MTLRDAVEIVARGADGHARSLALAECIEGKPQESITSDMVAAYARAASEWDRARFIVDAAVEFVEAYESATDNGPKRLDDMLVYELEALGDLFESAYRKLRALEAGEDPQ